MPMNADALAAIAIEAGSIIMDIYLSDFSVSHKDDSSPVTLADEKAEAYILAALEKLDPELPLLAEEAVAAGRIPAHGSRFALIDPLDGTKEFINKRDEFTVNIGIIENGVPVMGVVYAPALGRLFVAENRFSAWQAKVAPAGQLPAQAQRQKMQIRKAPAEGLTAIASKSHRSPETNAFLEAHNISNIISAGSSLKFCLIAAGEADLYPRHGRTMEWDTAAGQAVAEAAGARVTTLELEPLAYGKKQRGYDNPFFIVWGDITPTL